MSNKEISRAKIETTAAMCRSFYVDFMPMIKKMKHDIDGINYQLADAEKLLEQMKQFFKTAEKADLFESEGVQGKKISK